MGINLKRGGNLTRRVGHSGARGPGRAGHIAGQGAKSAAKLAQRGGERAGHQAGRAGHAVGQGLKNAANFAQKGGGRTGHQAMQGLRRATGLYHGKKAVEKNMKQQAKQQVKEAAAQLAKKGIREAEQKLAVETAGLSVVLGEALIHWRVTIGIIVALFLFFFMMFEMVFDPPPDTSTATPLQVTKTGPPQVANGKPIDYSVTVSYSGSADDITITDPLPDGTSYVPGSATPKATYDKGSNTLTWDAKTLNLPLSAPIAITVTFTLNPTKDNIYAINQASATISGGSAGDGGSVSSGGGGNIPPNTNTCTGMYATFMHAEPSHQNYGDPNCELVKRDPRGTPIFDKDKILAQLKTIKPSEAMGWFICVIPNESGYNANAYLKASTSGQGAYGLVQMNPTGKGNGPLDDGEVNWDQQLSNGINYNDTKIGHTFSYWPTSYQPCLRKYGIKIP